MIHTVGVAGMMVSRHSSDILITHALGSCLGITVYDFKLNLGGLLHPMLPDSSIDKAKLQANPFMFVDSGLRLLLDKFYQAGSEKRNLIIRAAGGSSSKSNDDEDFFQIGRRNFVSLRKILWNEGLMLKAHDIGGYGSRTVTLEIEGGRMAVRHNGLLKYI